MRDFISDNWNDFFNLSQEFFCIAGNDGYFKRINDSFIKALGYTEEELLSRPFNEFIHPDDYQPTSQELELISAEKKVSHCVNRYRCKDGHYIWLSWNGSRINNTPFIFSSARDITEHKEIERQHNLAAERLHAILNKFNEGYINLNKDWIITAFNPAAVRISQYPPEKLLNAYFWDLFEEGSFSKKKLKKALEENVPITFEEFSPRIKRWKRVTVYPYDGALTLFYTDITEQRIAQENLKLSNERYQLVNKATNEAIYDWNILENVLYWGEGYERILGYKEYSCNLSEWAQRIHPQDLEGIENSIEKAVLQTDVQYWQQEYRYKRIDDTYAVIVDRGYILRNESGEAVRMVGAMQDISKNKENEYKILQQNERLQQIAQINSHDIRKPLANILGILDMLQEHKVDTSAELLELLKKSGVELDEMVREISKKTVL
ncbi:PAS domain S-box protein [Rubrolithibacter danxiaensis]|uniref:PAS domain S-box protein n=1 Tax=Rubrolithibacter danxiaensis TaxID=3390805 RepID=UPI003BF88242